MTRVLAGRFCVFAENHILTEGQAGFRPGRGCADRVLVLRGVSSNYSEKLSELDKISDLQIN